MSVKLLGERLVARGFLTSEQQEKVVARQLTFIQAGHHIPLGHIAVMMGYVQREDEDAMKAGVATPLGVGLVIAGILLAPTIFPAARVIGVLLITLSKIPKPGNSLCGMSQRFW